MRYFLISYRGDNIFGSMIIESSGFPSHEFIKENFPPHGVNVCVMNIFEFGSENDYNLFMGKKEISTLNKIRI